MKQVTLNIPEKKYKFFIELLRNLDFVKENNNSFNISEEEKNIVRRRIKNARSGDLKKWDDVVETFRLD